MPATPEPPRFCPRCGTAFEASEASQPCAVDGYRWYPDPKVAAGVVVTDAAGRILLVKRNHEPAMGRWAFPSGYVDAGEVLEEAAAREVREETGIEVRLERLLGAWSRAGEAVVFLAYAALHTEGIASAGPEAEAVEWFAPDALPPLAFPHDDEIIAAWRAGVGAPLAHRPAPPTRPGGTTHD